MDTPSPQVREGLRQLLTSSAQYLALDPATRREIAQGLVKICTTALALAQAAGAELPAPPAAQRTLARAQSAGSEFSGVATARMAATTQAVLNAVSFPRFVTELINGVFKAMVDTNQQQMSSYVELIRNIATTTEGFADANVGANGARQWLVERFPGSFTIEGETDPFGEPAEKLTPEEQAELDAETRLRLRPGASMPSEAGLRSALGLGPGDSLPGGDPENLVPIVRSALARSRQQMLSTMVMMGLQRIVIESGRLHASMRFHIDTRSAAQDDRASQFDARHTSTASGSFGYGPWGASASMTNTIGYVSTQKTQTTEEMNTDLDLNSSVELVFKTDYVPLDRLAGREQVDRIKVHTLNPEAEEKAAGEARAAREKRYAEGDAKRRESLDKSITAPPAPPAPPKAGEPGSPEAAEKAREKAAKEKKDKPKENEKATAEKEKPKDKPKEAEKKSAPARATALGDAPPQRTPDVIFAPTVDEAAEEMLDLAGVGAADLLYDLGCGDGRIVITAARRRGCRAVGIDIDPERVAEARENVRRNGVESLVRIDQGDIFEVDLRQADVVMLYLLPQLNVRLLPQLLKMKPGARIVSQDFAMEGVIPDRAVQVYLPRRRIFKTFYLWTAPLRIAGRPVPHEWSNADPIAIPAAAC